MGADVQIEGQHVIIRGVDRLSGCPVDACDIRAGAALVMAAIAADGYTTVAHAEHIDRGYDRFVEKMTALGGAITRETVTA